MRVLELAMRQLGGDTDCALADLSGQPADTAVIVGMSAQNAALQGIGINTSNGQTVLYSTGGIIRHTTTITDPAVLAADLVVIQASILSLANTWLTAHRIWTPEGVVVWNPNDASPQLGFNFNQRTVTKTGAGDGWVSVRATRGRDTGKLFFEGVMRNGGVTPGLMIGVSAVTEALNVFVGGGAGVGVGYRPETDTYYSANTPTVFSDDHNDGVVIGCAVDIDAGSVWFSKQNVWQGGGDPATGANPIAITAGTMLYPTCSAFHGAGPQGWTGQFKAAALTNAPPSGFVAFDS